MNTNDFIKQYKPILQAMFRNGINPSWVSYEGLLDDYERLKAEGHSQMSIIDYLCKQYFVSKAQIYRVLAKLKQEIC